MGTQTEENKSLLHGRHERKRFSSFSHFNELIYLWIQPTALQFYLQNLRPAVDYIIGGVSGYAHRTYIQPVQLHNGDFRPVWCITLKFDAYVRKKRGGKINVKHENFTHRHNWLKYKRVQGQTGEKSKIYSDYCCVPYFQPQEVYWLCFIVMFIVHLILNSFRLQQKIVKKKKNSNISLSF